MCGNVHFLGMLAAISIIGGFYNGQCNGKISYDHQGKADRKA